MSVLDQSDDSPAPPPAPVRPVVDMYHGVAVVDPYRWLEDSLAPEVREWREAQNRHARSYLDSIAARPAIRARVRMLTTELSADHYDLRHRGRMLFAIKNEPPKQQPLLVVLASADDLASERVVVDPNLLDPGGSIAIDFFEPSPDGRFVAACLSAFGSEDGSLHVYEVATGQELGDRVPRVHYPTGGGSVAWNAEATGFWYTRYPHEGERSPEDFPFFQQIYFHRLGEPVAADRYVIGNEFPRIAEVRLATRVGSSHVLASVANGDGGEVAHWLRMPRGDWRQVTRFDDEVVSAVLGPEECLYVLSRKHAPHGRILAIPLATPELGRARLVVPEASESIQSLEVTDSTLHVRYVDGGPALLRTFDRSGTPRGTIAIEPVSAVTELVPLAGDDLLFRAESFVSPPAWYRVVGASHEVRRTRLRVRSPADFGDVAVVREHCVSRDGTRVPLNILQPKGLALDGRNPVLLSGYGGFDWSLAPSYWAVRQVWLEQGGIWVIANLRGGGEYGEEWHRAGCLTRKQNVFDDFLACATHLIERGYTSPDRLAIRGASNGGLLMGAALTQCPELFAAVLAHVGIYDMLRVELDPNGAFNVTEFGTVRDPGQFEALSAYSPYHHVQDGTHYPAVLLTTGENDARVNPAHSRKMAARLQAATASRRPVLLCASTTSGHGQGTALDEQIEEDADLYAFLFDQLSVPYRAISSPR